MRRVFVVAVLAILGACAALDLGAKAPPSATSRGHEVAKRVCASCHAVEPKGASPREKAPAFASLEMRHTASLQDRVAELTTQGHYEMPPLNLSADEVRDLVSYIASLEVRKGPDTLRSRP